MDHLEGNCASAHNITRLVSGTIGGVSVADGGICVNPSGDAELIRICRAFAKAEFTSRHTYMTTPEDLRDTLDDPVDWETLHWIAATPATTPAGWCAKALAVAAWEGDCYEDSEVPLIRSLIHDMAGQAIVEILGPLEHGGRPDKSQ